MMLALVGVIIRRLTEELARNFEWTGEPVNM